MAYSKSYPSLYESVKDFIPMIEEQPEEIELCTCCMSPTVDKKNNRQAEIFRKKGNFYAKKHKHIEAIMCYTESINNAKESSEAIVQAYFKRASVLYQSNLYEECLEDIQRAIDNNCPKSRMDKLDKLKKDATENLKSQIVHRKDIPEISDKHEWIECASKSVDLSEDENGRYIIAAKDIAPGELIAMEKPVAICIYIETKLICHECVASCMNPIPCLSCTLVQYCSVTCRDIAWQKYHKHECFILKAMRPEIKKIGLSLKLALMMRDYSEEAKEDSQHFDPLKEIINLRVDPSKHEARDIDDMASLAVQLFHKVKKYTSFFEEIESPQKYDIFKALVFKLILIRKTHFRVKRRKLALGERDLFDGVWDEALAFFSMFRQSCAPNVSTVKSGTAYSMRALLPIKKGDIIFCDYECCFADVGKRARAIYLRVKGNLECQCEACVNDWPTFEMAPTTNEELFNKLVKLRKFIDANSGHEFLLGKIMQNLQNMAGQEWVKPSREWISYMIAVHKCHEYLDRRHCAIEDFAANVNLTTFLESLMIRTCTNRLEDH